MHKKEEWSLTVLTNRTTEPPVLGSRAVPRRPQPPADVTQRDATLVQLLQQKTSGDEDYWAFKKITAKDNHLAYYQYPAMMVPQMQGEFIDTILQVNPHVTSIYDPFAGSGTVLGEAMARGLSFYGGDINPLAVLLCKVKGDSFRIGQLIKEGEFVIRAAKQCRSLEIQVNFLGLIKWFNSDVAYGLSDIRSAIMECRHHWIRRFLWVCLAETVRLVSHARTSTYKLHAREDLERFRFNREGTIKIFEDIFLTNIKKREQLAAILEAKNLTYYAKYTKCIELRHTDSTKSSGFNGGEFDLLISSPPYGDNRTTVSYGQQAYLPLQWIDLHDIDKRLSSEWLENPYAIDNRSAGGSVQRLPKNLDHLYDNSRNLQDFVEDLKKTSPKKARRSLIFFHDMDRSLDNILPQLRQDAYMMWTVGNRKIDKKYQPMDTIFADLLTSKGVKILHNFSREIPSKRMARNIGETETMTHEHIILGRYEG